MWTEQAARRANPSHSSSTGILFEEDFDHPAAPAPPPEPEVIEPAFTQAELDAARAEAWQEGHAAALAAAEAATDTAARHALSRIAEQLDATRQEALELSEQSAEAIAELLMSTFAAAFPALCARHGETELLAVVRHIVPALHQEPRVTIRLDPHLGHLVSQEIQRLDPDLAARVQVIPTDSVVYGDIRIAWRNGTATRDTATLWSDIADILASAGLAAPQPAAKEMEHVE